MRVAQRSRFPDCAACGKRVLFSMIRPAPQVAG